MKTGTWGVRQPIKKKTVALELVLSKQKDKIRAVPEKTAKRKDILLKIIPGRIDKMDALPKLQIEIDSPATQEELLSALPAGGVSIKRK